jgi:hypothetical protein
MRLAILAVALMASQAAALDPHLPADTQLYVSLDLKKILDSPLFKDHLLGPARDALKGVDGVTELLDELGLDPFKDISRVIIASPDTKEADRGLVILHGTFDAAKLKAKAAKLKKEKDESVKVHDVPLGGGVKHEVYEVVLPGDASLFVALAAPKVLLASPGKDYIIDALKQGRAGKKPALKSKQVQELIEQLDAKNTLSIAVPGKMLGEVGKVDWLPGKANEALAAIDTVGGGLAIGEEFRIDLAISSKDEENAKTVRDYLKTGMKLALAGLAFLGDENNPGIGLLFEVVKSAKVGGKGRVATLTAELKAGTLKELFGMGR